MPRETLSMELSSDEAKSLLEIFYSRIDSLNEQIRRIDSEIKFIESLILTDNEESVRKMNEAKEKTDELQSNNIRYGRHNHRFGTCLRLCGRNIDLSSRDRL